MALKAGKTGTPTATISYSPSKRRRVQKARRREERYWASLAGPVTVTKVQPSA